MLMVHASWTRAASSSWGSKASLQRLQRDGPLMVIVRLTVDGDEALSKAWCSSLGDCKEETCGLFLSSSAASQRLRKAHSEGCNFAEIVGSLGVAGKVGLGVLLLEGR